MKSQRLGVNRFSPTCPCNFYRTTDGWVGVTALTPAQWAALAGAIGRPDLGGDERYLRPPTSGWPAADEVDAVLAPAFAGRSSAEWVGAG